MNTRSHALAERLEKGARALATFAEGLTEAQWQNRVPGDGRKVGVVVHHVASIYPLEVQLAMKLASGEAITGLTWADVHQLNAGHAVENDKVSKEAAIALLRTNSAAAAKDIRALTDAQLDAAATVSMYADAPLTCQFFIEDHALRHSYHHLAKLKGALAPQAATV